MAEFKPNDDSSGDTLTNSLTDLPALSIEILNQANQAISRPEFLRGISRILAASAPSDIFEILLSENSRYTRCRIVNNNPDTFSYETIDAISSAAGVAVPDFKDDSSISDIIKSIIKADFDKKSENFMADGSFWSNNIQRSIIPHSVSGTISQRDDARNSDRLNSLAIIPIKVGNQMTGVMQFSSAQINFFTKGDIEKYHDIAKIIGIAAINHQAQLDLRERLKELSCAYRIAQIADEPGKPLDEILQYIVTLLPSAWMYPEIAASRIVVDGHLYTTPNFRAAKYKQSSYVVIKGIIRGAVEVFYLEKKPELDEGPFLKEERKLIDNIARQIALIVEKKEAEAEKVQLQAQIRHADRLATIGQLAAGVAHELNEPLGNILGFAQLLQKSEGLPKQAVLDIDKIVGASLHAREIIKKLMLFARQTPSQKNAINLNAVVEEGLYFFEARCAKAGIKLIKSLAAALPEITGDQTQLRQVLVNLVVNAIQAMPAGGMLVIRTYADKSCAYLAVEDTGVGMTEEVMKKIFIPFYTTKDINEGTGLGLAVVHGIVTLHRGSIDVKSEPDRGSRFIINLPIGQAGYIGE